MRRSISSRVSTISAVKPSRASSVKASSMPVLSTGGRRQYRAKRGTWITESARTLPVLFAVVTAFVACGGNERESSSSDRAEFRTEFEALAGPLTDTEFDEVLELAETTCSDSEDVFALTYAMLVDGGGPSSEGFRLQVRYFCPERLDELEP